MDLAVPQGVAVFRYDKRGLGQSTGTFEEVTVANSTRVLAERASDVRAIVEFLATRPDIRADQIFLWGTSQGAWVAPLVTTQTSRVAFIIGVSGGGSSVGTSDHYDELTDNPAVTVEQATAQLASFTGPFGYDPERGGGVFQIERLGYDYAELIFHGWNKDIGRNTRQRIEVRKGNNSDIRIAVVRQMVAIIREYEQEDFLWVSQRLRRNVMLSARPRDRAGLEDFMMREFFPEVAPAQR